MVALTLMVWALFMLTLMLYVRSSMLLLPQMLLLVVHGLPTEHLKQFNDYAKTG